jgi:hypothetical protein
MSAVAEAVATVSTSKGGGASMMKARVEVDRKRSGSALRIRTGSGLVVQIRSPGSLWAKLGLEQRARSS